VILRLDRRVFRLSVILVTVGLLVWFTVAGPGLLSANTPEPPEPKGICAQLSSKTSNTELKMQNRLNNIEGKRTAKQAKLHSAGRQPRRHPNRRRLERLRQCGGQLQRGHRV
jgi:hypothetical protein